MAKGHRQGRLGEEIKKIISEMLRKGLKDPRLQESMISITDVEVTRDGSYATCFVTVFSTASEEEKETVENDVMAGLESAKGVMRKEIGSRLKLRHAPELIFKMDRSLEYGRHIDELLKKIGEEQDG